jgi:hypothetical protein
LDELLAHDSHITLENRDAVQGGLVNSTTDKFLVGTQGTYLPTYVSAHRRTPELNIIKV